MKRRNGLDPSAERALFRGTVGEAAAVEFAAFLKVWRELPHPRAILNDPENAGIPGNASALMALCGALYKLASDVNFDAIATYATRLRREVGESLVPVLRTTPCSSRCTSRRSSAAAAPTSRCRRRPISPNVDAARLGRPDRRGGLGFHTRRIVDAGFAMAANARDWLAILLILYSSARSWRAGINCHR